jgi:hypothetical protein
MADLRLGFRVDEDSWDKVWHDLHTGQKNLQDLRHIRYIIGSNLPYATHWIEDGWRDDPRFGKIRVNYRQPAATGFMKKTVKRYGETRLRRRRPSENIFGAGFVPVKFMQDHAGDVVEDMRETLDKYIYSKGEEGDNPKSGDKWRRTWDLYGSIKSRRV